MTKYNPHEDWYLDGQREIPKEGILFTFKTHERRVVDAHGSEARLVADRLAKTEEDAWKKLKSPQWSVGG